MAKGSETVWRVMGAHASAWAAQLLANPIHAQALAKGEALFAIRVQRFWRQWRANHLAELLSPSYC